MKELINQTRRLFSKADDLFLSLSLRIDTLTCIGYDDPGMLSELVEGYRELFATEIWNESKAIVKQAVGPISPPTAAWEGLPKDFIRELEVLTASGWNADPAIGFLADAIRILGVRSPRTIRHLGIGTSKKQWRAGNTWLLFARNDRRLGFRRLIGRYALLRIDVLSSGSGLFYPDPMTAAHLSLMPSFQSGFLSAWGMELGNAVEARRDCDYRWSIVLIDSSASRPPQVDQTLAKDIQDAHDNITNLTEIERFVDEWLSCLPHHLRSDVMCSPLQGKSTTAACAVALRSALEQMPLIRDACVTAQIAHNPQLTSPVSRHSALRSIYGLDSKLKAIWEGQSQDPSFWEMKRLYHANDQTLTAPTITGHSIQLKPVHTADDLFRTLSESSRRTQALKRFQLIGGHDDGTIPQTAQAFFQAYCFANPTAAELESYQPLKRHNDPRLGSYLLNEMEFEHSRKALSEDDYEQLLNGQVPVPVLLIADSGTGKSTLLQRITLEVALAPNDRVAIPLQNLSQYLTSKKLDDFIEQVFNIDVAGQLGQILHQGRSLNQSERESYRVWFQYQVKSGNVIFLFDALDQTAAGWSNLSAIVNALQSCKCSCYVTVRPDSVERLGTLQTTPQTIRVNKFSREFAKSYLGNNLYNHLVRVIDQDRQMGATQEGILSIPMLLYLLKTFYATNEDAPTVRVLSRYAIYEQVLCGRKGLIAKGLVTLKQRKHGARVQLFKSVSEVTKLLGALAFWQLSKNHFENAVTDNEAGDGLLSQWMRQLVKQMRLSPRDEGVALEAITQINIVTGSNLFKTRHGADAPDSIFWRHRSFVEFFAGRYLAGLACSTNPRNKPQSGTGDRADQ